VGVYVDVRYVVLFVGPGVLVTLLPSLISPVLVAAAVGTLLWIILRLGCRAG
jgi:hypothetical protein